MRWGVKIPLRDGVQLSATLYLPRYYPTPGPAIFILTPYIAQTYHEVGVSFAAHGYPFLAVDSRGRGNSEGHFRPCSSEAQDGHDVVEWLAAQSYCNGKVAMCGGSYSGLAQWATAKEFPPHLATVVPVAALYMGFDVPIRSNMMGPYWMRWLTLVSGRTSQDKIFWNNEKFWAARFREWFESGVALAELDIQLGNPSATFQEWLQHPHEDAYWDRYNPTSEQYSRIDLPILTITGSYDSDQPGALNHYREHLKHASSTARARHYLVIGPWDHDGTRVPQLKFAGLDVGLASLVDLRKLHRQWYAWTMQGGAKPEFLQGRVAYYVMGADRWRYCDTLDAITSRTVPYYLSSTGDATDVFRSGLISNEALSKGAPDCYVYDPRDVSAAEIETTMDPENVVDQRMTHLFNGRQLVYHSAPFEKDVEISGFFRLSAWIAIDQPDTDFRVAVYEIGLDGSAVRLTFDQLRARYRQSFREPKLIRTTDALRYEFDRFTFISRQIKKGHRLRLVIGPIHSIYAQRNHNSGGVVAQETMQDARPVTVTLFHDVEHPCVLHVPYGHSP